MSRLEESPAKKISEQAKRLLSRIPIQPRRQQESLYGFQTFVPLQDAMRVIAATVDGAPTLSEMMKRLDERTDNYNILKSAKAFIEQLPPQAKAVFFANFAMSTNNFILPKTTTDENGNVVVQFPSHDRCYGHVLYYTTHQVVLSAASSILFARTYVQHLH